MPINKNKIRWIVLALFSLLFVFKLVPYNPALPEIVSNSNSTCSVVSLDSFLQEAFREFSNSEKPQNMSFRRLLDLKDVSTWITERQIELTLLSQNGETRKVIIDRIGEFSAKDYHFEGKFTPAEKAEIIERTNLEAAEEYLCDTGEFWTTSDIYAHIVMLLMGLSLLYLFFFGLPGMFSRKDVWLLAVLGLGAINLFVFTDAAVGDIKLHFINEAHDLYIWDAYGPGYFSWQKLVYRFLGTSDDALFFANRMAGLLCAAPLYVFMRNRFQSRPAALAAALLLLTHPTWLRYSASDLTHSISLFFFFSGLALLLKDKQPENRDVPFAVVLMVLSMLGRGEFMPLSLAGILLLGVERLKFILRHKLRLAAWSTLAAIGILTPYLVVLAAQTGGRMSGMVSMDLMESLKAWLWFPGYNTYTDPRWSAWPHVLSALLGFILMFKHKTWTALALFAVITMFLWNPFFFRPLFTVTHYQLIALPFYIVAGGFFLGVFFNWLSKHLGKSPTDLTAKLAALGLCALVLTEYSSFLSGDYGFMQHYSFLKDNKDLLKDGCVVTYSLANGDHALSNPELIWFDRQRQPQGINLVRNSLPHNFSCVLYLELPSCYKINTIKGDSDFYLKQCRQIEAQFQMEKLVTGNIDAKGAFGEAYMSDPVPVAIWKILGRADQFLQDNGQNENPENP